MIYIHSPNHFDEQALRMMGLSAKVNDNSIGRFGTGLKYAVAIVLRTGGALTIRRASAPDIAFRTTKGDFRGKEFIGVEMQLNGAWEPLPFTLDYGQDWEPWKAYRELVSNAYDEGGDVSDEPCTDETVIEVEGLDHIRERHSLIFLDHERSKLYASPRLELSPGSSSSLYYRNIRARDFPQPLPLTVNILSQIGLTEDRTIASEYAYRAIITDEILEHMTEPQIEECFRSRLWTTLNCRLNTFDRPSAAFMQVARTSPFVPNDVAAWLSKHNEKSNQFTPRKLTASDEALISSALEIVQKLIPEADRDELTFVNKLVDAHGLYDESTGNIYIAATTFIRGRDHLAATIYEELCHKHYGYRDESREFQEHLLQTLIGTVTRL